MPLPSRRLCGPAAITLAASLALVACSSSTGGHGSAASVPPAVSTPAVAPPATSAAPATSAPVSSAPVSSAPASVAASTPPAPISSSAATSTAPASGKVVKVNKPFADAALGESGTVLAYLRDFQASAAAKKKYSVLQDEEVVLVEVKVNSSKKYYDDLGSDSFFLLGNDGVRDSPNNTIAGPDMTKDGYPPLKDATNGASQTGWIAYPIDKGFSSLTLQYYTLAATTTSGKTIPAKTVDVKLT